MSQCPCLWSHFPFWVIREGESQGLPATLPESETALVQNGPVSVFDFPWGLTGRSVAQSLWRRTRGSRGSSPRPPGPSNVLRRKETLINTQFEIHITVPWNGQIEAMSKGKGGPGRTLGRVVPSWVDHVVVPPPEGYVAVSQLLFCSGFLQILSMFNETIIWGGNVWT